jgi:hypothetical protein
VALITGLMGLVARFAGRVLNTTLGWATILLFGKVAESRQTLLLVIVLASLAWVAAVVGILVPEVGVLLIAAIPAPDFVDDRSIRLGMLAVAVTLPLLVGTAAIFVTPRQHRASGRELLGDVLRGYAFTFVLALSIVLLGTVATVRKLRSLAKRWEDAHVAVIVKPGSYEEVLQRLQRVLAGAGLQLEVKRAPTIMSAPARLLNTVAGRALGELVPDELKVLHSPELSVLVYPSDLAISGTKQKVALARATIAAGLTRTPAYMTTTAEAQAIEDRIEQLAGAGDTADGLTRLEQVRRLDRQLAALTISFDEWETLYRMRLQLERDLLAKRVETGRPARAESEMPRRSGRLDLGLAIVGFGLLALDVALLVSRRREARRRDLGGISRPT